MKSKLPFLLPLALVATIAIIYFAVPKSKEASRSARPRTSAPTAASEATEPTPETPAVASSVESKKAPEGPGFVDRLLGKNDPEGLGPIAEEIESGKVRLSDAEVARVRTLLHGSASSFQKRIILQLLAALPDPDGKNLAALREAAQLTDPFLAHSAFDETRNYAKANPAAVRDVNSFLLSYAGSSADEEARQAAVAAVRFDTLEGAQLQGFQSLLRDGSEEIRLAALFSVGGSSRKPDALKVLSAAFFADPSLRVKQQIVEIVAGTEDPSVQRTLESFRGAAPELDASIDEALHPADK